MNTTFLIIDDDISIRKMIGNLITSNKLGRVIDELSTGENAVDEIMFYNTDIVIVDMLLPGMDGVDIVNKAIESGYTGKFIMVSQVQDPGIKAKAYNSGVLFFISKPINSIEVISVISNVSKSIELERSLNIIKSTVYGIDTTSKVSIKDNAEKIVDKIFSDIGIINESGAKDLKAMVLYIYENDINRDSEFTLKELYTIIVSEKSKRKNEVVNLRSFEQKIRRIVTKALHTVAMLGIEDYYNLKFMDYSTILFDLKQVKQEMNFINEESLSHGKINIKRFIEGVCSRIKQES